MNPTPTFYANVSEFDINMPLTQEICEFVGAIIGDGCIDGYVNKYGKYANHVFITGNALLDHDYLTKKMAAMMFQISGKSPTNFVRKNTNAMVLNTYSKNIFALLTQRFGFKPGNKTYTVTIPREIIDAGEEFIFSTIRGIFDTDGCVYLDKRKAYLKPYPRIVLRTASKPLFFQLKEILGKYFSLYAAEKMNGQFPINEIVIYGPKQVEKWMQLIGFSNQRHLRKLEAISLG